MLLLDTVVKASAWTLPVEGSPPGHAEVLGSDRPACKQDEVRGAGSSTDSGVQCALGKASLGGGISRTNSRMAGVSWDPLPKSK